MDASLRFEGLSEYALNNKGYTASFFDMNFMKGNNEKGIEAFNLIVDALIIKHKSKSEELIVVKESINTDLYHIKCIEFVDYIIKILKE